MSTVQLGQKTRVSLYHHNVTVDGVVTKINKKTLQITFPGIGGGELKRTFYKPYHYGICHGYGHRINAKLTEE